MKSKKAIILITILLILMFIVIGLILLYSNKVTELNIEDSLIQDLYSYIDVNQEFTSDGLTFYRENTTFTDLNNKLKLNMIFENLTNEKTFSFEDDSLFEISKEEMENTLYKLYGPKATIVHESFYPRYNIECIYEDGRYNCRSFAAGGGSDTTDYRRLIKAEKQGNYIYIYDKHIRVVGYFEAYLTSDEKILLDKSKNWDYFGENYWDNVQEEYGDKLKTFKHTYKKDKDTNYYWISTEIMN